MKKIRFAAVEIRAHSTALALRLPFLRRTGSLVAVIGLSLTSPTATRAATLTVTSTNDNGAGSLRQAIHDSAPGDTLDFSVTGVIALTNGQLLITNDLTIAGPGATNLALSGNYSSRVFQIGSNATVSISALTICYGYAPGGTSSPSGGPGGNGEHGGGVYNIGTLTLTACALSRNGAGGGGIGGLGGNGGHGGGIYNAGTLTANACTLSGNHAGGGGGLFHDGGRGGDGGGIYNDGTLTLIVSTVSGNSAGNGANGELPGGSGGNGGNGGGIYNARVFDFRSCTIARNLSGRGGSGASGGYFSHSGNGGDGGSGGGIYNTASSASAHLGSTLFALNSLGDYGRAGSGPGGNGFDGRFGVGLDLAGPFTSNGHNFVGETNGSSGFTNGINGDLAGSSATPLDAKLGLLQDNGGPTWTMALLAGSPALDQGDDALVTPPFDLASDQRGQPRKSGAHVDIAAYELQKPILAALRSGTDIVVRFNTERGQNYRVERKDQLAPGPWTPIADNFPGTGNVEKVLDSGATALPQRFYRAAIIP